MPTPGVLLTDKRTSGEPGPLLEQPEPHVPAGRGPAEVELRAAGPPVAHRRHELPAVDAEDGLGVVDVGVLDDVEQGLLEEAVDRRRRRHPQ